MMLSPFKIADFVTDYFTIGDPPMALSDDISGTERSVAFLGPLTSYSHQAALKYFPKQARFVPQSIFSDVFAEVQAKNVDFGVVPVENSSNGPVDMVLDCLADPYREFPNLFVTDEMHLDINHCLLGKARSELGRSPGTSTEVQSLGNRDAFTHSTSAFNHITDVYSHPQALGQCRQYLAAHLKHAKLHETSSTSEAASIVAKLGVPTAAAISSQLAGEAVGLDILATRIQDGNDNVTRFLIVTNEAIWETLVSSTGQSLKMLISFRVSHEAPGALADALAVFKAHKVNLKSINSRPSRDQPWHYIFLIELVATGNSEDAMRALDQAVDELRTRTTSCHKIGHWWLA